MGLLVWVFTSFLRWSQAAIVLVPGTGNSLIPHYFSEAVQTELARDGERVVVASGLAPFGDLRANGERVLECLRREFTRGEPLKLVGHSAGGLYALWAVHQNAAVTTGRLNIVSVATLAAPFEGAPIANLLLDPGVADLLARALSFVSPDFFDLRGLTEMTSSRVRDFIEALVLPEGFAVFAVGSKQEKTLNPFLWFNSQYLNPFLALADGLAPSLDGDGLVPLASALGRSVTLRGTEIRRLEGLTAPLDHQEMVYDRQLLRAFGFNKTTWVEAEQRKLFGGIREALKAAPRPPSPQSQGASLFAETD